MIPYDRAFRLGMALSCLHSTKGYAAIVMVFSESATSFEVQAYLSRLVVGLTSLVGILYSQNLRMGVADRHRNMCG